MVKPIIFSGMKIYSELGILDNSSLIVSQNKIKYITQNLNSKNVEILEFPENFHLVPGFIDLHVHGANGSDVMDGDVSALRTISEALIKEGTTAFLATTMTAKTDTIENALAIAHHFVQIEPMGAAVLGVHLEGPFIAPDKIGAQNFAAIQNPNLELITTWQKKYSNIIKLITIAPELPNAETFIKTLTQQNIIIAMGHSNATYQETCQAIDAGCSYATHLFNAMRGIHQREPGIVTAVLESEKVFAELIVDGEHLHPAIINLVLRQKGFDKLLLVTDAMRAKCLPEGNYELGGQMVCLKNNTVKLSNGTLAGSVLKISDAMKNFMKFTGSQLADVLKLTSENPAKVLNIFSKKGSIKVGKDADLVVLDNEFNVVLVMVEGRIVFQE